MPIYNDSTGACAAPVGRLRRLRAGAAKGRLTPVPPDTFCSCKKYPKTRRGLSAPGPLLFYGGISRNAQKDQHAKPPNDPLPTDRAVSTGFACRPTKGQNHLGRAPTGAGSFFQRNISNAHPTEGPSLPLGHHWASPNDRPGGAFSAKAAVGGPRGRR